MQILQINADFKSSFDLFRNSGEISKLYLIRKIFTAVRLFLLGNRLVSQTPDISLIFSLVQLAPFFWGGYNFGSGDGPVPVFPVVTLSTSCGTLMFDIHFKRFIANTLITVIWVLLIITHFLNLAGGMIFLAREAYLAQREYAEILRENAEKRKEYTKARQVYDEAMKKYPEDMKKYDEELEKYKEAVEEARRGVQRGIPPKPQEPDRPREPNEPFYEKPKYTGPTWQFFALPVTLALSLLVCRLILEFVTVVFRIESNTRAFKREHSQEEEIRLQEEKRQRIAAEQAKERERIAAEQERERKRLAAERKKEREEKQEQEQILAYANTTYREAKALFQAGQFEGAMAKCNAVLDRLPHAKTFLLKAMLWEKYEKYKEMLEDCTRAIELDPHSQNAYWVRATALKHLIETSTWNRRQRRDEAVADLSMITPDNKFHIQAQNLIQELNSYF